MKGRRILMSGLALGLLMALAVGLGQAQGREPDNELPPEGTNGLINVEDTVTSDIPIQGRLTDAAGNPVPDGTYSITFRLYDAEVGGTLLCEDTDTPTVTKGLFTALMGYCTASDIDGRELWLGIQVEGDEEMTPRQRIGPVPYARSLRPGAVISDTTSYVGLNRYTSYMGITSRNGVYARASGALHNYGVYGISEENLGAGVSGSSHSPNGYGGYFDNDGGGYALGVEGGMEMTINATGATPINVGDRYRDNAIIAWANVNSDGTIGWDFGVNQVIRRYAGTYLIELDADTAGRYSFVPIVIAEVNTVPDSADEVRIVSIKQINHSIFEVYVTDGNWHLEDNQFVFMVTGR